MQYVIDIVSSNKIVEEQFAAWFASNLKTLDLRGVERATGLTVKVSETYNEDFKGGEMIVNKGMMFRLEEKHEHRKNE